MSTAATEQPTTTTAEAEAVTTVDSNSNDNQATSSSTITEKADATVEQQQQQPTASAETTTTTTPPVTESSSLEASTSCASTNESVTETSTASSNATVSTSKSSESSSSLKPSGSSKDLGSLSSSSSTSSKKFKGLNINTLYKGKSLENPKTSVVVPKHGLQTVGKVGAGLRRVPPPANIPLKSSSQSGSSSISASASGTGLVHSASSNALVNLSVSSAGSSSAGWASSVASGSKAAADSLANSAKTTSTVINSNTNKRSNSPCLLPLTTTTSATDLSAVAATTSAGLSTTSTSLNDIFAPTLPKSGAPPSTVLSSATAIGVGGPIGNAATLNQRLGGNGGGSGLGQGSGVGAPPTAISARGTKHILGPDRREPDPLFAQEFPQLSAASGGASSTTSASSQSQFAKDQSNQRHVSRDGGTGSMAKTAMAPPDAVNHVMPSFNYKELQTKSDAEPVTDIDQKPTASTLDGGRVDGYVDQQQQVPQSLSRLSNQRINNKANPFLLPDPPLSTNPPLSSSNQQRLGYSGTHSLSSSSSAAAANHHHQQQQQQYGASIAPLSSGGIDRDGHHRSSNYRGDERTGGRHDRRKEIKSEKRTGPSIPPTLISDSELKSLDQLLKKEEQCTWVLEAEIDYTAKLDWGDSSSSEDEASNEAEKKTKDSVLSKTLNDKKSVPTSNTSKSASVIESSASKSTKPSGKDGTSASEPTPALPATAAWGSRGAVNTSGSGGTGEIGAPGVPLLRAPYGVGPSHELPGGGPHDAPYLGRKSDSAYEQYRKSYDYDDGMTKHGPGDRRRDPADRYYDRSSRSQQLPRPSGRDSRDLYARDPRDYHYRDVQRGPPSHVADQYPPLGPSAAGSNGGAVSMPPPYSSTATAGPVLVPVPPPERLDRGNDHRLAEPVPPPPSAASSSSSRNSTLEKPDRGRGKEAKEGGAPEGTNDLWRPKRTPDDLTNAVIRARQLRDTDPDHPDHHSQLSPSPEKKDELIPSPPSSLSGKVKEPVELQPQHLESRVAPRSDRGDRYDRGDRRGDRIHRDEDGSYSRGGGDNSNRPGYIEREDLRLSVDDRRRRDHDRRDDRYGPPLKGQYAPHNLPPRLQRQAEMQQYRGGGERERRGEGRDRRDGQSFDEGPVRILRSDRPNAPMPPPGDDLYDPIMIDHRKQPPRGGDRRTPEDSSNGRGGRIDQQGSWRSSATKSSNGAAATRDCERPSLTPTPPSLGASVEGNNATVDRKSSVASIDSTSSIGSRNRKTSYDSTTKGGNPIAAPTDSADGAIISSCVKATSPKPTSQSSGSLTLAQQPPPQQQQQPSASISPDRSEVAVQEQAKSGGSRSLTKDVPPSQVSGDRRPEPVVLDQRSSRQQPYEQSYGGANRRSQPSDHQRRTDHSHHQMPQQQAPPLLQPRDLDGPRVGRRDGVDRRQQQQPDSRVNRKDSYPQQQESGGGGSGRSFPLLQPLPPNYVPPQQQSQSSMGVINSSVQSPPVLHPFPQSKQAQPPPPLLPIPPPQQSTVTSAVKPEVVGEHLKKAPIASTTAVQQQQQQQPTQEQSQQSRQTPPVMPIQSVSPGLASTVVVGPPSAAPTGQASIRAVRSAYGPPASKAPFGGDTVVQQQQHNTTPPPAQQQQQSTNKSQQSKTAPVAPFDSAKNANVGSQHIQQQQQPPKLQPQLQPMPLSGGGGGLDRDRDHRQQKPDDRNQRHPVGSDRLRGGQLSGNDRYGEQRSRQSGGTDHQRGGPNRGRDRDRDDIGINRGQLTGVENRHKLSAAPPHKSSGNVNSSTGATLQSQQQLPHSPSPSGGGNTGELDDEWETASESSDVVKNNALGTSPPTDRNANLFTGDRTDGNRNRSVAGNQRNSQQSKMGEPRSRADSTKSQPSHELRPAPSGMQNRGDQYNRGGVDGARGTTSGRRGNQNGPPHDSYRGRDDPRGSARGDSGRVGVRTESFNRGELHRSSGGKGPLLNAMPSRNQHLDGSTQMLANALSKMSIQDHSQDVNKSKQIRKNSDHYDDYGYADGTEYGPGRGGARGGLLSSNQANQQQLLQANAGPRKRKERSKSKNRTRTGSTSNSVQSGGSSLQNSGTNQVTASAARGQSGGGSSSAASSGSSKPVGQSNMPPATKSNTEPSKQLQQSQSASSKPIDNKMQPQSGNQQNRSQTSQQSQQDGRNVASAAAATTVQPVDQATTKGLDKPTQNAIKSTDQQVGKSGSFDQHDSGIDSCPASTASSSNSQRSSPSTANTAVAGNQDGNDKTKVLMTSSTSVVSTTATTTSTVTKMTVTEQQQQKLKTASVPNADVSSSQSASNARIGTFIYENTKLKEQTRALAAGKIDSEPNKSIAMAVSTVGSTASTTSTAPNTKPVVPHPTSSVAEELNIKFGSVKKLWENPPPSVESNNNAADLERKNSLLSSMSNPVDKSKSQQQQCFNSMSKSGSTSSVTSTGGNGSNQFSSKQTITNGHQSTASPPILTAASDVNAAGLRFGQITAQAGPYGQPAFHQGVQTPTSPPTALAQIYAGNHPLAAGQGPFQPHFGQMTPDAAMNLPFAAAHAPNPATAMMHPHAHPAFMPVPPPGAPGNAAQQNAAAAYNHQMAMAAAAAGNPTLAAMAAANQQGPQGPFGPNQASLFMAQLAHQTQSQHMEHMNMNKFTLAAAAAAVSQSANNMLKSQYVSGPPPPGSAAQPPNGPGGAPQQGLQAGPNQQSVGAPPGHQSTNWPGQQGPSGGQIPGGPQGGPHHPYLGPQPGAPPGNPLAPFIPQAPPNASGGPPPPPQVVGPAPPQQQGGPFGNSGRQPPNGPNGPPTAVGPMGQRSMAEQNAQLSLFRANLMNDPAMQSQMNAAAHAQFMAAAAHHHAAQQQGHGHGPPTHDQQRQAAAAAVHQQAVAAAAVQAMHQQAVRAAQGGAGGPPPPFGQPPPNHPMNQSWPNPLQQQMFIKNAMSISNGRHLLQMFNQPMGPSGQVPNATVNSNHHRTSPSGSQGGGGYQAPIGQRPNSNMNNHSKNGGDRNRNGGGKSYSTSNSNRGNRGNYYSHNNNNNNNNNNSRNSSTPSPSSGGGGGVNKSTDQLNGASRVAVASAPATNTAAAVECGSSKE